MRYALLIYTAEPSGPVADDVIAAEMVAYDAFGKEAVARGAMLGGEALVPTTSATTVRVRDGRTLTTDGPYAETKEALGGFYLIEAADLDGAIGWAAKIPGATHGVIEIRPIWEVTNEMASAAEASARN